MLAGLPPPKGRFAYHLKDESWEWDDDVYRIHGREPGSVDPTEELVRTSKHVDDVEHVKAVLDRAARDGGSFAVSYRAIRADGSERQVLLTGCCYPRNSDVETIEGYFLDLTTIFEDEVRKEASKSIQASSESRSTIEQAKGALMVVYGLSPEAAFTMLQWWSKNHNVKLRDLASRLMEATQSTLVVGKGLQQPFDNLLYDLTSRWSSGEDNQTTDRPST
ncbi:PAS and ANTAR domain-containing protein [Nocardioides sp. MH1]|uniref:PAS and ANTAR domain-containing protein n=1 Tax=Nocardioides sp. MH1 TaxID=3242490 RepID=UPI0035220166